LSPQPTALSGYKLGATLPGAVFFSQSTLPVPGGGWAPGR